MTTEEQAIQELQELPTVHLYHLPGVDHSGPEPVAELDRLKTFLNTLIQQCSSAFKLQATGFVLVQKVMENRWARQLTQNGSYWRITTGIGVRPGRPAFQAPDYGRLMSRMKHLFQGSASEPPAVLESVYHIGKDPNCGRLFPGKPWPNWVDAYLGSGGSSTFLSSHAEFLQSATQLFGFSDNSISNAFDFTVPLFELEDFQNASAADLQTWFSLFDIYIAEVPKPTGLLVASRHNLDTMLDQLGYNSLLAPAP